MSSAATFLLIVLCVLLVPYAAWAGLQLRRVMPLVMVQFGFGILVGPELLGRLVPEIGRTLASPSLLGQFSGLSWLAVVLFGYLIGMHAGRTVGDRPAFHLGIAPVAIISTAFAVGAGATLAAMQLDPRLLVGDVPMKHLAVVMGLCAGVTALPVLGAILRETDLIDAQVGRVALTWATVNDAIVWIALALLLAVARLESTSVVSIVLRGALYTVAAIVLLRPLVARIFRCASLTPEASLLLLLGVAIAAAFGSEAFGLHPVFGGVLAGMATPAAKRAAIVEAIEPITVHVLLPFFFTMAGLQFRLSADLGAQWLVFLAVVLVAELGKFLAALVVSRYAGLSWKEATALAFLMLTKGAVDLVVIASLVDAGLLPTAAALALLTFMMMIFASVKPMLRLTIGAGNKTPIPTPQVSLDGRTS